MAQWGVHQDGGSFSGSKVVRPVALKFSQSALLHLLRNQGKGNGELTLEGPMQL